MKKISYLVVIILFGVFVNSSQASLTAYDIEGTWLATWMPEKNYEMEFTATGKNSFTGYYTKINSNSTFEGTINDTTIIVRQLYEDGSLYGTYTFDNNSKNLLSGSMVDYITTYDDVYWERKSPIIDSDCKIKIKSLTVSGTQEVNNKISFTVNATSSCSETMYYRFSVHSDYGTDGYDGLHWSSMTDSEWVTNSAIDYTFDKAGKYIIVVWVVTDINNYDVNGIPIIGWSVDIDEEGDEPYFPF